MAPVLVELKNKKDLEHLDKLKIKYKLNPLNGFIYLLSLRLHIAEEETPLGKNWYEAHEALIDDDSRMPTILEFVIFLKHLKKENQQLYEKVIRARKKNPWKLTYFDDYFIRKGNGLCVLTGNQSNFEKTEGGIYVLRDEVKANAEKLENTLLGKKEYEISFKSWLKNPTSQGLPSHFKEPRSDEDRVIYYPPQKDCVVGVEVSLDSFILDCRLDPFKIESGPSSGVWAVKQLE